MAAVQDVRVELDLRLTLQEVPRIRILVIRRQYAPQAVPVHILQCLHSPAALLRCDAVICNVLLSTLADQTFLDDEAHLVSFPDALLGEKRRLELFEHLRCHVEERILALIGVRTVGDQLERVQMLHAPEPRFVAHSARNQMAYRPDQIVRGSVAPVTVKCSALG